MTPDEVARISEHVSDLTRAGLPLASGLRALGEELPPGRLRRMLGALAHSLDQGASLDTAIAAQGTRLPAHLRSLVLAGERTGRLGEVLARFAGYTNINVEVRRQLWLRLAYPFISLALALAVLLFFLTFPVGEFQDLFHSFGLTLPLLSQLVTGLAAALKHSGGRLLAGGAALGVLAIVALSTMGPVARRTLASRLPLLGPVWHWTSLAEFCHLLGILLESDLSLVEALPLAGAGVPDGDVRVLSRKLTAEVERGNPLSSALGRQSNFPAGLGQIVSWAESHQCLAGALHMLGEMFETRARAQAVFASTVLSVLTVLLILVGVTAVIGGVLLPMINLIQALS
jgi:general secretion pathway protein F